MRKVRRLALTLTLMGGVLLGLDHAVSAFGPMGVVAVAGNSAVALGHRQMIPGLPAGQAAGGGPIVRVGSLAEPIDQVGGVTLQALNMPSPGLGAWTVDVDYASSVVTATSCTGFDGGICNATFGLSTVRVVGAVGSGGFVGNTDLASINFRCLTAGHATLQITLRVLSDGTTGNPQPISASVQNGTIDCGTSPSLAGDVNCDGFVGAVDAELILQDNAGIIASLPCPHNADVNRDAHITPVDAALILQLDAGIIHAF